MTSRKVVVFGPTGGVGSAVARTAHELGAQVVLAMRNTEKPIPGLDSDTEKHGGFERVYADLTKPDTVSDAVEKTGAKHAFLYLGHGSPDHMRATIEALKGAGIESVVFLSSFTIQGDLEAVKPSDVIPYLHAQVEINLRDVFGADGFVAARPGSFASNSLQYKAGLQQDLVKVYGPDVKVDCIVQADIGAVCGTVLAKGAQDGQKVIYLYGPKLLPQTEVVKILAKVLGRNPKIVVADEQDAYKMFVEERRMPEPIAKYMLSRGRMSDAGQNRVFGYPVTEDQMANVEKYTGRAATSFEQWAEQNKVVFSL